ncbi:hypothetical protein SLEP1_g53235 [Rubroshorea leprosula]|uniref:Uncharacterized protein n=1 Tax=Rubroshorea leprosula TaxID=152421 RepID=A0AAV5M8T2_9ROSI|nr:hypothetical protein SLEP1_g53235 [Rubroshorea leprosula]
MATRGFINSTLPKVDRRRAREKVLTHAGATVVKHTLELRWDHDEEGHTVFSPNFDFEFITVKEGKAEAVGTEVEKSQPPPPVEIHPVPLEEE